MMNPLGNLYRCHALRVLTLLVVTLGIGVAAGCAEPEPEVVQTDPCAALMDEMAIAREIDDQIVMLDTALVVCRSPELFAAAMSRHSSAIAVEPSEYVSTRCYDPPSDRVGQSRICRSVVTTTTSTTVPDDLETVTYTGRTLDGRDVEISSRDTLFAEGRPATIVQIVDIGTEDGCDGVEREYERWLAFIADPEVGDEASVYAQHSLNVLGRLGCDPPTTVGP